MEQNYSLADIAAATGENGFGGNWVLILLFAMIFGGNGFYGNRRWIYFIHWFIQRYTSYSYPG